MALLLQESNLYVDGFIEEYPDGTRELNRELIDYLPHVSDKLYRVLPTETLTTIAYKVYGGVVRKGSEQDYWHVLAQANSIDNPLVLSEVVGTDIIIPDILRWKLIYG